VLSAPFSNCYAEYCYDKYNKSTTLRIKNKDIGKRVLLF
jgi:hypothetical protein